MGAQTCIFTAGKIHKVKIRFISGKRRADVGRQEGEAEKSFVGMLQLTANKKPSVSSKRDSLAGRLRRVALWASYEHRASGEL